MQQVTQFIPFGEFIINVDEVLYFWERADSIQCYLRNDRIPLIANTHTAGDLAEQLHQKCPQLIAIGDYLVNSDNVCYFWKRDAGVQAFFDWPIPLGGKPQDKRLDALIGK